MLTLADRFHWEVPASAMLLAGWLTIASAINILTVLTAMGLIGGGSRCGLLAPGGQACAQLTQGFFSRLRLDEALGVRPAGLVLALGVLERDGVWISLGLLASAVAGAVVWGVVWAMIKAAVLILGPLLVS